MKNEKINNLNLISSSDEKLQNKKIECFKFLTLIILVVFLFTKFTSSKANKISFNLSKKSSNQNKIDETFITNLKNALDPDEICENEMMNKHTTFRTGGPARIFVRPKTIEHLVQVIKLCNKNNVFFFVIGNGSNLLVSDKGYNGVLIQIREENFSQLKVEKKDDEHYLLQVGGGMLMKTLSIESCLLSLTGLEDIIDIPGTVGGGIIMNASFKENGMFDVLLKVKVVTPDGNILELSKKECNLVKRGSMLKDKKYIVVEATFKLEKGDQMKIQKKMTENTKMRYEKQPMYFGSAGCFFKWNHAKNGGMYVKYKESDLVSYRVGNAMIYTYNIAFIVNLGQATSSDVMAIVNHIEKIMKNKYQIDIEREVVVIGSFKDIDYY
jgi:UDP-N-acetylmuramate dehydrogenase